jgi:hypothetical protein
MGYIGLLLNAPYKIDSMVWMWMWMMFDFFLWVLSFSVLFFGYINLEQFKGVRTVK